MTQTNYHKLKEFFILINRTDSYCKKLTRESLKIAHEKGLEIILECDAGNIHPVNGIVIKGPRDNLDYSELIELSNEKFPSLYRKYYQGIKKLEEMSKGI